MDALINRIRGIARDLLREGKVDVVIGFEEGTIPFHSRPCFVRSPDEADRLIWNSFCENNLATYVVKRNERMGIVAKGCDTRALLELIKERQVIRDQIYIIGVPCKGMIDRVRVEAELRNRSIQTVEVREGTFLIVGKDFEKELEIKEFLYPSCQVCTRKNPVIYDELVGEEVEESVGETYPDIESFEGLSDEKRWQYFSEEMSRCIRCYACRNACPLCYCTECFVDASNPQWIGKSIDESDTALFHIMRAFHLAGRCVECGACERACPLGINIRKLNRKLSKDVLALFNYKAGISLDEVAPLATYRPDDSEAFILEP
jgi:formate dehydrogenase (coenzyme F420) beta subunit